MAQSGVVFLLCCASLAGAVALKSVERSAATRAVPVQESFDDMVAKRVDTSHMMKSPVRALDGKSQDVTIMDFPSKAPAPLALAAGGEAHLDLAIDQAISGTSAESSRSAAVLKHQTQLCLPFAEYHRRGVFLDVGADIGTYALPMAQCINHEGKNFGTVIAFEGMPTNADHLRAGIVENKFKNVHLYRYAVAGPKDPEFVTRNTTGGKEVQVPSTTLDTLLAHDPRFTSVLSAKISIGGNEGRLLKGGEKFFEEHPPCYLVIDLVDTLLAKAHTPLPGVLAQLEIAGYKNVPKVYDLLNGLLEGNTVRIHQKNLAECTHRVEAAYEKLGPQ